MTPEGDKIHPAMMAPISAEDRILRQSSFVTMPAQDIFQKRRRAAIGEITGFGLAVAICALSMGSMALPEGSRPLAFVFMTGSGAAAALFARSLYRQILSGPRP